LRWHTSVSGPFDLPNSNLFIVYSLVIPPLHALVMLFIIIRIYW
jgi:hypothetical protein